MALLKLLSDIYQQREKIVSNAGETSIGLDVFSKVYAERILSCIDSGDVNRLLELIKTGFIFSIMEEIAIANSSNSPTSKKKPNKEPL
jgi:hypothetical protein